MDSSNYTQRAGAVFTIVQSEPEFLPVWIRHYSNHFDPCDIYVLDHNSTGPSLDYLDELRSLGYPVINVYRTFSFDHDWLCHVVSKFQQFLLASYAAVLFTEVDELVVPLSADGTSRKLLEYMEEADSNMPMRCNGYEVIQTKGEAAIDLTKPLLPQRRYWAWSDIYSKPLLARSWPLSWYRGFHGAKNVPRTAERIDRRLLLLHLHKIDLDLAVQKHRRTAVRAWNPEDLQQSVGAQNRQDNPAWIKQWFGVSIDDPSKPVTLEAIPPSVRAIL